MRKFLISLAAAGAALAVASPAAAQYYPGPQSYGYGNGYGYGVNNYGQVRSLQYRINAVQRLINRLDNRDRIGEREARRLRNESRNIERRLFAASRYGLNPYEANDINRRIFVLEQRVQYAANNGWRRYGSRYGWNGNYGYSDRDRDGRNDRYEDDRGRDHD
jgi:hypothetical protein